MTTISARSALSIAALLAIHSTAYAQLEEVIVTAQKRTETSQDVPIAIAAITGDDLARQGVTSVAEVANYSPNVQLDSGAFLAGSSQVLTGFIRGIGQNDVSSSLEPGVGVYVDGVYLARSIGANVDLLDVERVEILKGPQGTLFGRNTIGGAVSVITRQPEVEFGWRAEATVGSRNLREMKATVDLPLIDNYLLSQFSASMREQDGYQKILPWPGDPGTTDEAALGTAASDGSRRGGIDNYAVRGKLLWLPTDATEVRLSVDYAESDESSGPFTLVATNTDPTAASPTYAAVYNTCISTPAAVLSSIGLGAICGPRYPGLPALAGANVDGDSTNDRLLIGDHFIHRDIDKTYGNGGNVSRVENYGATLTIESEMADWLSITSITAWRGIDSYILNDLDGTPVMAATYLFDMKQRQLSQELQFNMSLIDDRLQTVAGIYYFEEESENTESAIIGEGLGHFHGPYDIENESLAAYFHSNYELTDRLGLTLGARWTRDEKEFDVNQADLNMSLLKLGIPAALFPDQNDLTRIAGIGKTGDTYTDTSIRVGFEYRVFDDAMLYASWSEGFKSGGQTTRLSLPTPGNAPAEFGPEQATTYELGIKSRFFNNRMQLNAALFRTDYEDMQITVIQGISPFFQNAGEATIKGAELDLQAMLTDNLRISAGVGYLDAGYEKLDSDVSVDINDALVNTPEWTASLVVDWEVAQLLGGTVALHADAFYKSEMARDAVNTPVLIADDHHVIGVNASWTSASEALQLIAGVKNLENERFIASGTHVDAVGATSASYSRPREWYLTVRYRH